MLSLNESTENIAVIARDRREFNSEMHFIAAKAGGAVIQASMESVWMIGNRRYFYLYDMKQVKGLRRFTILPVGNWIERQDLNFKELEQMRDASWA